MAHAAYAGRWRFETRSKSKATVRRDALARLDMLSRGCSTRRSISRNRHQVRRGRHYRLGARRRRSRHERCCRAGSCTRRIAWAPRVTCSRAWPANIAIDGFDRRECRWLGDAFDVMWRANRRNVQLLRAHFEREGLI